MSRIRCLIVEDEPLAAEILQDHIAAVPLLDLVATCSDALKAMNVLSQQSVDLIFLDLHLPRLKGFEFLRSLTSPPKVIVTTAYHEYALESYEFNVVDYLLKPIEFPRFLKAVNKVASKSPNVIPEAKPADRAFQFFNVNKKQVKVYLDEILYIESLKDYVKIFLKDQYILTKFKIGELEEILPSDHFLRVHRSFIIALKKISAYDARSIEMGNVRIPVGRSYKRAVDDVFKTRFPA